MVGLACSPTYLPRSGLRRVLLLCCALLLLLLAPATMNAQEATNDRSDSRADSSTNADGQSDELADWDQFEDWDEIDFEGFDSFMDPFSFEENDDDDVFGFDALESFDSSESPVTAPASPLTPLPTMPRTERSSATPLPGGLFLDFDDLDALFTDSEMIDVVDEAQTSRPQDDLLTREGVRVGGRIRGSVNSDWLWNRPWTADFDILVPNSQSLSPALNADLFFDARPSADFRAFTRLRIATTTGEQPITFNINPDTIADNLPAGFTAETNDAGDTDIRNDQGILITTLQATPEQEPSNDAEPRVGSPPSLSLSVFEMFFDFAYQDDLLFRFGKHTITWGTGFFWSPADVLNLTAINVEDPTADREGPLSLKVQYPFGIGNDVFLYLIFNTAAGPLDVAIAPRVNLFFAGIELGIGLYYQRALSPRLALTFGTDAGDFGFFGEAVFSLGSDRIFIRPARDQTSAADNENIEVALETFEVPDLLFFSGTVGLRYLNEIEDVFSLFAVAQYFFNGDGYDSITRTANGAEYQTTQLLPAAARLLLNPGENAAIVPADQQTDDYEDPPALRFSDLANFGRHYAGLTLGLSRLFGSDVAVSVLALANLSDGSGIISPSLSVSFLERFSLTLGARLTFGPPGAELTNPTALFLDTENRGPTFAVNLNLSISGGSF